MSLSYHMILLKSAWRKDVGPYLSLAAIDVQNGQVLELTQWSQL